MFCFEILAAQDPLVEAANWIGKASGAVILAFVVLGFIQGWIAPGRECTALREERDRAIDLVYKQAEIAQRALDVTERKL